MKRIVALLLSVIMIAATTLPVLADGTTNVNAFGQAYVVFGADLDEGQFNKVLELLEVTEEELDDYVQLEVTNEEEHQYLDAYLESSVIGKHAYSSVKMIPKEKGYGLSITTNNINYCTVTMYKNALITAGMEDAEVVVAGPFEISGTAALIGTVKAYSDSRNEEVNEEALETATNELVLTGELKEELGDESVADLIAYAKQMVIENDLESEEEIRDVVIEAAKQMEIELTDKQVEQIVALMKKISKLDIDPEALEKQAADIYNKLKDLGVDFQDTKGILDFIKNFFQEILDFLTGLFS